MYGVLYEAEHRSTFYVPYWKFPPARWLVPRQRKFATDMALINATLTDLINQARDTRQVGRSSRSPCEPARSAFVFRSFAH